MIPAETVGWYVLPEDKALPPVTTSNHERVPPFVALAVKLTVPAPQRVFPVAEATGISFTATVSVAVAEQPLVLV